MHIVHIEKEKRGIADIDLYFIICSSGWLYACLSFSHDRYLQIEHNNGLSPPFRWTILVTEAF